MIKKITLIILTLVLVISIFPTVVFADEPVKPPIHDDTKTTQPVLAHPDLVDSSDMKESPKTYTPVTEPIIIPNASPSMQVVVSVDGQSPDVTVNGNQSTSLTANGIPTGNVQLNGDKVVSGSNYGAMAMDDGHFQTNLMQRIQSQQSFILETTNQLYMTMDATVMLIQNGKATQEDLKRVDVQIGQINLQAQELYKLTEALNKDNQTQTDQMANIAKNLQIQIQNSNTVIGILQNQNKELTDRLAKIEQYNYQKEHSGIIYDTKMWFSNLFNNVKEFVGQFNLG